MFDLPEELPADAAALADLRAAAGDAFDEIKQVVQDGGDLTDAQLTELRGLADAIVRIDEASDAIGAAEQARRDEANALISKIGGDATDEVDAIEDDLDVTDEVPEDVAAAADVVTEAEQATQDAVEQINAAGAGRKVVAKTSFSGLGKGKTPTITREKTEGWRMEPGSVGYKSGFVGFKALAEAIDAVTPGGRAHRASNRPERNGFSAQTLARLDRKVPLIADSHALVKEITKATNEKALPGGSLTAAGGWCAPSEQLYDFCEVPVATDLVSLPEITIRRGGVRWPVEPDLSAIFASFQFFFTETELEAVDGGGDPTAVKNCVEVPCPDTFVELRLNAVGYCVEAGILQDQGWPELIEWFLRSLAQEHFRAISRRTIVDMVTGSGSAKIIPASSQIATGSAFLNSLALQATNLRLNKGLGRTATIEGVAPSWVPEMIRADLANQEGIDTKAVSDAQIVGWLSARNISLQWVADWQTRTSGLPGNLATVSWPTTVDVLLYPAGTWFRAMSNVIELGTMYPKEQLQVNRYTRFFTEDAIVVGKRCDQSILVRVPVCASGAVGDRQQIACSTNTPSANEVQSLTAQGTVSGGTFVLSFNGQNTTAIAWNASAATIKAALDALSNLAPADTAVTGGALPGTPVVVTFQGAYAGVNVSQLGVDNALVTGGGSIQPSTGTQGQS